MYDFIDLFSGIGGMRKGLEEAALAADTRVSCVFSSEIDKHARETYLANFPEGPEPEGDIRGIAHDNIPPHDILLAGFPCQPFSIAGVSKLGSMGREHGFLDETRGTLFHEIVRILKHRKPQAFLLENVRGLEWHDDGNTMDVILRSLRGLGYSVPTPKMYSSERFVPQKRERIFIVGFRDGTQFQFTDIPEKEENPVLRDILQSKPADKYTLRDNLWQYHQERKAHHKEKGNGFGYRSFGRGDVAGTLSARYGKDGADLLIRQRGKNPRMLTPLECARLMGFEGPKEWRQFKIPVSNPQAYKQFGNAVVPQVVAHIAKDMLFAMSQVETKSPK